MNSYKDLKVWNEAIEVAADVYRLTTDFPQEEKFGLISQMRRSSVSISSNIAEGAGRNNKGEFNHFLGIALGSACELESQLMLAEKLGFINLRGCTSELDRIDKIQKMLYKLKKAI